MQLHLLLLFLLPLGAAPGLVSGSRGNLSPTWSPVTGAWALRSGEAAPPQNPAVPVGRGGGGLCSQGSTGEQPRAGARSRAVLPACKELPCGLGHGEGGRHSFEWGSHTYGSEPQQERLQAWSWSTRPDLPLPACLAANVAWVLGPGSLRPRPRACYCGSEPAPRPDLLFSHQVYFFCSASACSPSELETCSTTCSSGPASESGLGHRGGWGLHSHVRRPVLAPGQPGAGDQAVRPSPPAQDSDEPTPPIAKLPSARTS